MTAATIAADFGIGDVAALESVMSDCAVFYHGSLGLPIAPVPPVPPRELAPRLASLDKVLALLDDPDNRRRILERRHRAGTAEWVDDLRGGIKELRGLLVVEPQTKRPVGRIALDRREEVVRRLVTYWVGRGGQPPTMTFDEKQHPTRSNVGARFVAAALEEIINKKATEGLRAVIGKVMKISPSN